jgi:hypothetical protein
MSALDFCDKIRDYTEYVKPFSVQRMFIIISRDAINASEWS